MNTQNGKHIAILGLGWLGEPLALELHKHGFGIHGSTTRLSKLKTLSKHPFYTGRIQISEEGILGDWETFIADADILIINIPPRRIENIEGIYPAQIQQIINGTPPHTKVIFVSSTAVYGQSEQACKETDTPTPIKASGQAVLNAEQALQAHFGTNVTILRLAGLIGPNRHPGQFLAGKRTLKNPDVPVNLIHQTDCIGLIKAIINQDAFGEIFNGCASHHPIRKAYYQYAAKIIGLPQPQFQEANVSAPAKVIDNLKSKEYLGYTYTIDHPEHIFTKSPDARISILGAGPGDYKLLTVEALERIQTAEVILHDNLISEDILALNTHAEKIYVGRKYGDKTNQKDRQDRINQLLEKYYQNGQDVVRLKSGDPYVYGRAAEEARYLTEKALPFTVVPGISAALAAANTCNIPITERHHSNAVLICTAHTADYSFDQLKGIAELLKAGNTLALYMGLKSLDKLIPKLLSVCKDPNIPVNAISKVSRPDQFCLTSSLGDIENDIKQMPLEMPVVFLIGVKPIQSS